LTAVLPCLAALYESWAVPIAVLLVVPLGVIGAIVAAYNFGRRLKTLKGLTPYEAICKAWGSALARPGQPPFLAYYGGGPPSPIEHTV